MGPGTSSPSTSDESVTRLGTRFKPDSHELPGTVYSDGSPLITPMVTLLLWVPRLLPRSGRIGSLISDLTPLHPTLPVGSVWVSRWSIFSLIWNRTTPSVSFLSSIVTKTVLPLILRHFRYRHNKTQDWLETLQSQFKEDTIQCLF